MGVCVPTEIWTAIVGIAGAMLGVWYGAGLAKKTAIELVVRQSKAEFLAIFTDALVELNSHIDDGGLGDAHAVLQKYYPSHLGAYLKLHTTLPAKYRYPIEEAWHRYIRDDQHELQVEKDMYRFAHILSGEDEEQMRQLALQHLSALIRAVNET